MKLSKRIAKIKFYLKSQQCALDTSLSYEMKPLANITVGTSVPETQTTADEQQFYHWAVKFRFFTFKLLKMEFFPTRNSFRKEQALVHFCQFPLQRLLGLKVRSKLSGNLSFKWIYTNCTILALLGLGFLAQW